MISDTKTFFHLDLFFITNEINLQLELKRITTKKSKKEQQ